MRGLIIGEKNKEIKGLTLLKNEDNWWNELERK